MLRALVVILILANVGFLAWRQGWLDTWLEGFEPLASQREPQRLKQQVNRERLIVLPPPAPTGAGEAASEPAVPDEAPPADTPEQPVPGTSLPIGSPVSAALLEPGACYQAGPLTAGEHRRVSAVLSRQLPEDRWTTRTVPMPGLWMVYMGPYTDPDMMARKQAELQRFRNLSFEEVKSPPTLAAGLSLGRFNDAAKAEAALESLRQRGVRTARVVTLRPPADAMIVRVPQASADVQRWLPTIPLPRAKAFAVCSA